MTVDAPLVVIAGGGTGGHLYPGLAVADELVRRGHRVAFVGTARGIEARVIPETPYDLHLVPGAPVRGRGARGVVTGLVATARGIVSARRLLRRLRPAVVLGVGGYASVATVVAATLARIPTVLQEQNAVPGVANRLLGRVASAVCVGFAAAEPAFPARRVQHTGNPVRSEIASITHQPRADGRLGLLVFGGSQGARRINEAVLEALPLLGGRTDRLAILHQTGMAEHEAVSRAYETLGIAADVRSFIGEMAPAYASADLVVARAGAMSCAEITAAGLPCVLVPYPHAAGDHQRVNAEALVRGGAAVLLSDVDCDGPHLAEALAPMIDDDARRGTMAANARAIARPTATAVVADVCGRFAGTLEAGAALR